MIEAKLDEKTDPKLCVWKELAETCSGNRKPTGRLLVCKTQCDGYGNMTDKKCSLYNRNIK